MANVFTTELTEVKLNSIINPDLKEGLLTMIKGMADVSQGRWTTAEGLYKAFNNYEKEVRTDDEGNEVKRFATKGKFYEFINVKDANGSQMISAVEFNDLVSIDGKSLKEHGFTVGKVYTLSSMVGNDDLLMFFEYAIKAMHVKSVSDMARLSDKGLINMVKSWKDSLNTKEDKSDNKDTSDKSDNKDTSVKSDNKDTSDKSDNKDTSDKSDNTDTSADNEVVEEVVSIDLDDIHREDIFKVIRTYCLGESDTETQYNVIDFIKQLKKEYGITKKF